MRSQEICIYICDFFVLKKTYSQVQRLLPISLLSRSLYIQSTECFSILNSGDGGGCGWGDCRTACGLILIELEYSSGQHSLFTVEVLEYEGKRKVIENGLIAEEWVRIRRLPAFGNCKFFGNKTANLWVRRD